MKKGFEGAPYVPEATPEEVAEHLAKQNGGGLNGLAEKLKDIGPAETEQTEAPSEAETFIIKDEEAKRKIIQLHEESLEKRGENFPPVSGEQKLARELDKEGRKRIKKGDYSLAVHTIPDIPGEDPEEHFSGPNIRKRMEETLLKNKDLQKGVKKERQEKIGKVTTAFTSHFDEEGRRELEKEETQEVLLEEALPEVKKKETPEPVLVARGEKVVLPKSTREYIDSRRTGIENDTALSRTQKDEFLKLTDELEGIEKDFGGKKLSSAEAFEKRGRKKRLKSILTTGAEVGITKEQVESAREAGMALGEAPANLPIEEKSPEEKPVAAKPEKVTRAKKPRAKSGPLDKVQSIPKSEINPEEPHIPTKEERKALIEARAAASAVIEKVPEKEKGTWLKKILEGGLYLQELKNKGFEKAIGGLHDKLERNAQGPVSGMDAWMMANEKVRPFLKSLARSYEKSAKKSKEDRIHFRENGKASSAGAWMSLVSGGILGARVLAGPMAMVSRFPAALALSLARFTDVAKETHLDKKMHEVSEDTAAEEAWAIYEAAQGEAKARGEVAASFDDLSLAYGKGVLRGGLDVGEGVVTSVAMRKGLEKIIAPIKEKYEAIQSDASLSVTEKQKKTNALFRVNDGVIKDIDRLVGPAGTIDAAGYNLRRAGVWSKRVGHLVALESLAEFGFNSAIESMSQSDVVPSNMSLRAETQGFSLGLNNIADELAPRAPGFENPAHVGDTLISKQNFENPMPREGETISKQDFENLYPWDAVAEASPENATETIKEGGSIWRSAKAIQEKLGMDNVAFAEGWENSTVTLPDGREIPLSGLDLVHAGDSLSYEDGKFVFENGSGIEHAEVLGEPIASQNFEEMNIETEEITDTTPEISEGTTDSVETTEYEPNVQEEFYPVSEDVSYEQLTSPENIEREMNRDLYAIFGTLQEDRSEWTQWKTMSARKVLEKMQFPDDTPAKRLQHYLSILSRGSDYRPIGGFFRREESVEVFIKRALAVVIQRESAG